MELDERLLATPSIALGQCHNLVLKMAEGTAEAVQMSLRSLKEGNPAFFEKLDDYSRKYRLPQE